MEVNFLPWKYVETFTVGGSGSFDRPNFLRRRPVKAAFNFHKSPLTSITSTSLHRLPYMEVCFLPWTQTWSFHGSFFAFMEFPKWFYTHGRELNFQGRFRASMIDCLLHGSLDAGDWWASGVSREG